MIDAKCVDIIHPDLATSGGLLETKKIADYAQEAGIAAAFHQAGTPVTFMANVHCAAASENFLALEHHGVDNPDWGKVVKMTGSQQAMYADGFANIPLDSPGLGIELIDDAIKEFHMPRYAEYGEIWAPTDSWNNRNSNDRLWS